jgi:transposase, IS30 family
VAYHQITPEERHTLATLRKQVPTPSNAEIGRLMGRHRSTIAREIARNSTPYDGTYRPSRAQEQANGRRSRSRRNTRFTKADWKVVFSRLREGLSPEQVAGRLDLERKLTISYESIYRSFGATKSTEASSSGCCDCRRSGASGTTARSVVDV